MRLTPYQAFMIESGAGDVRGSIITKKWPGAVLVYEIESSLSKLYDFSDECSLIIITNWLRINSLLFHQSPNNICFSFLTPKLAR